MILDAGRKELMQLKDSITENLNQNQGNYHHYYFPKS